MRHLFFWNGIEDASFKKTDGGFVFYPWGPMGAGYLVSEGKKAEIVEVLQRYYWIATILIVVAIAMVSVSLPLALPLALAAMVALLFYYGFKISDLTGGLPRSSERLTFGESQRASANTMSYGRLYFALASGILMTAASLLAVWLAVRENNSTMLWIALGAAVFFGAGLLMIVRLFRLKRSQAN